MGCREYKHKKTKVKKEQWCYYWCLYTYYMHLQCMTVAASSNAMSVKPHCKQNHMIFLAANCITCVDFQQPHWHLIPSLCIICKNVNYHLCQNCSPTLWIYSQHSWSFCLFSWPCFSQRCPQLCCKFHCRMGPTTTNNTLSQPIKISVCLANK